MKNYIILLKVLLFTSSCVSSYQVKHDFTPAEIIKNIEISKTDKKDFKIISEMNVISHYSEEEIGPLLQTIENNFTAQNIKITKMNYKQIEESAKPADDIKEKAPDSQIPNRSNRNRLDIFIRINAIHGHNAIFPMKNCNILYFFIMPVIALDLVMAMVTKDKVTLQLQADLYENGSLKNTTQYASHIEEYSDIALGETNSYSKILYITYNDTFSKIAFDHKNSFPKLNDAIEPAFQVATSSNYMIFRVQGNNVTLRLTPKSIPLNMQQKVYFLDSAGKESGSGIVKFVSHSKATVLLKKGRVVNNGKAIVR